MQDNWNNRLRDALDGFEMTPPDGLWERLASEIAPKAVVPWWRRRRLWAAAAVVALLLALGTVVWLIPVGGMPAIPGETRLSWISPPPVETVADEIKEDAMTRLSTLPASNDEIEENENIETDEVIEENEEDTGQQTDTTELRVIPVIKPMDNVSGSSRRHAPVRQLRVTTPGQLSIGILTACAGGSSSRDVMTYLNPDNSTGGPIGGGSYFPPDHGSNGFFGDDNPSADPGASGIVSEVKEITETRHSLPFRVGVTVQYRFNSRFALETGITYSRLSSETSVTKPDRRRITTYRLNYIGVPLMMKYRVVSWRAFDLYLSAGCAMEKCVTGDSYTRITTPGAREKYSTPLSSHPLQWSLSAGAGLQYRPAPQVGIYVEPSVVRYLDDRSPVPVIYDKRPVDLSLNLGLRFLLPR